ncbi:uncharacterized protein LOC125020039 [Mugil cephalus]|uniref:uncharacterized protein LOC125020039 n=1 Tax=Mugil cephalus TaxID=48193 RepID=UPI001FB6E938|nr:uncharacterized protein LOC125020039 [Mugil cephalus]
MTPTSPDKTPPRPQSVTSRDTETEYIPNNPFQDRQQREHGDIDYRAYREAEEEVKRERDSTIQRFKEFEDQGKRELMQDQVRKSDRNRPTPRDSTDLMWDLSEGEECEPPVTGAAAFTGKGRYEGQTRDVGVKWKLKGRWENRPQADEEEEEQIAELEREVEKATERLRASMEKTQIWVADAKGRRRSVRDRGKRDESRDRQDHHHLAIPLLSTAGQPDKYKPFTLGDIQTIVDKLPPVVEGGNRWLDKLDSLIAGQKLALGDFRAVAARCMTGGDLRDIETDANTKGLPDNAPFTRQSTAIGQAMRDKYPLPHAAIIPKLRWNPEQSPREFLTQAKDQWVSNTGCHPGNKSVQREWFRQAVLEGVPESVRNTMKNNLVQYVDDLLLAAPTAPTCLEATRSLLAHLAKAGFKVSKPKLQVARKQVSFLGRQVSQKGAGLSPQHKSAILQHPKPHTVRDMLSFLGLTGYSRNYIPDYSGLTKPLRDLIREHGMRNLSAPLKWTTDAEAQFIALKQALAAAADLTIPDYSLPFYLDVSGSELCTNGVLYQRKGGERVILTYVSVMLDAMEKRHPACTQHVAGVAKLIQKTAHIVMEHQLNVLTTHSVVAYVNSHTFTLTALRQRRLSIILEAPNLTFTHEGINMAEQMSNGEPHQCTERVHRDEKVRPDLLSEPIKGGRDLYTDGCCYRHDKDGLVSAYAVVEQTETGTHTVRAERIQGQQSAQRAEVLAVIAALEEGKDQIVNIYTDSAYAAGAVHVELKQWLRAGFLTANSQPSDTKQK